MDFGDSFNTAFKQQLKRNLPAELKQMLDKKQEQQCIEVRYIAAVAGIVRVKP